MAGRLVNKTFGLILILGTLLSITAAANVPSSSITSQTSDKNNVTLAINVPDGNSQDLYFHFAAPLNDQTAWVGFGLGSGMNNALIFVAYRSNNGSITISPRVGSGHTMPTYTDAIKVAGFPSSSISDKDVILDFKCTNCRDWKAGKLDVTSTSAPFFWALGSDQQLISSDPAARISQHSEHSNIFTLDMKAATGVGGIPVLAPSGTNPTTSSGSDNSGYEDDAFTVSRTQAAHAFVMSLAFVIVFPLGYLLLRLFDKLWLHWGTQSFGFLLVLLGAGSGIAISIRDSINPSMNHPHQIMGLIAFALIVMAWGIGLTGHLLFKRNNKKSPIMWVHRIVGPVSIALGFINGSIGLRWVGRSSAVVWGYIFFDLMVWSAIVIILYFNNKRKMRKAAMNTPAAWNVRHGNPEYAPQYQQEYGHVPPHYAGSSVPMVNMGGPPQGQHPPEYYTVRPK